VIDRKDDIKTGSTVAVFEMWAELSRFRIRISGGFFCAR